MGKRADFVLDEDRDVKRMRDLTGRATREEVIRDALSFYSYLADEIAKGKKLFLGKSPEKLREICVTTFKKLEKKAAEKKAKKDKKRRKKKESQGEKRCTNEGCNGSIRVRLDMGDSKAARGNELRCRKCGMHFTWEEYDKITTYNPPEA